MTHLENPSSLFALEWQTLQQQFFRYEQLSLSMKVLTIIMAFTLPALALPIWMTGLMVLLMWVQDAIWKTFQSRTAERLLTIESQLAKGVTEGALQLHSDWQRNRGGTVALLGGYVVHMLKPTQLFPYLVLLTLVAVLLVG